MLGVSASVATKPSGIEKNGVHSNHIIHSKAIITALTRKIQILPPTFSVESKTGELMGFEIDLANIMAASMGVKATFVRLPFGDLLDALESGKVDAVMSVMTITLERNLKAAFIGPYVISGKSILTKSSTLASAQESGDINQNTVKLTTLRGSTSEKFATTYLNNAPLTLVDDYDKALDLLMNGQVDALIADYPICAYSMLKYADQGFATLSEPLTIEPIGIALPASDALYLNLVENYFNALQISGLLDQLEQKWFEDGSWLLQVK